MTDAHDENARVSKGPSSGSASARRHSLDDHATSLRGAEPASVGRKFWLLSGALGVAIVAAVLAASFISITNDNARIDRLKAHGIPVSVTVVACIGNLGGSGSNGAGFTCRGDYRVGATTYHELIGSMTTFSAPGTAVRAVADPSKHSSVVLASALRTLVASPARYVAPGLLTLVLLALALALLRVARPSKPPRDTPSDPTGSQGA